MNAVGMDISSAAAAVARDLLDVEVQVTPVKKASYPRGIQAVVAFHVLEHLLEPRDFLASTAQALLRSRPTRGVNDLWAEAPSRW